MSSITTSLPHRLREFVDRVTSPLKRSEAERTLDGEGILESGRTATTVYGVVRGVEGAIHSVNIHLLSSTSLKSECSCEPKDREDEQWCVHGVALLYHAWTIELLTPNGGFPRSELLSLRAQDTPRHVALILSQITRLSTSARDPAPFYPVVALEVDHETDRLGVQVLFNGEVQEPPLIQGFLQQSSRTLDQLLIETLEERGSWDEIEKRWYLSSSVDIELVVGLLQEYSDVRSQKDQQTLSFSKGLLDAQLVLEWEKNGLTLSMNWVLSDGTTQKKEEDIVGTGPFWVVLNQTLYRLSPTASQIASLFPMGNKRHISIEDVGPLLEALTESSPYVVEHDVQFRPTTEIVAPIPEFSLQLRRNYDSVMTTPQTIVLHGKLQFSYPSKHARQGIVVVPDREAEQQHLASLRQLGFQSEQEGSMVFSLRGDTALDLLEGAKDAFPPLWKVSGVEEIRKQIKFAALRLSVQLSEALDSTGDYSSGHSSPQESLLCTISLIQNNSPVPLGSLFKNAGGDTHRWVSLDSGAFARVPGGSIGELKQLLSVVGGNLKLANSIKARLTVPQALGLSTAERTDIHLTLDSKLRTLRSNLLNFSGVKPREPRKGFEGSLRHYQKEGVGWLEFLADSGLGGILADEMGLGKTVQTLACIQLIKNRPVKKTEGKQKSKGPVLIIAPTSVTTNWLYEIRKFTPTLKALLLYGPERRIRYKDIPDVDIVITSYALARVDKHELARYTFSMVILDEAQHIKNPVAATTLAVKSIACDRRFALTGTPTENRPLELWSIMDFVLPGYLGSFHSFRTHFDRPIMEQASQEQSIAFLRAKISPFLLRRTKQDVEKQLPEKIEAVVYSTMTPVQGALYAQVLDELRPKVEDEVRKRGIGGASVSILAALLRLRQLCNHPHTIAAFRSFEELDSGKFETAKELITEALDNGKKVLLFSQFRTMLALFKSWLDSENVPYAYLDGLTKDRQDQIDEFNSNENLRIFLLSLKAGGVGLNLTAADTVILYDPWWNPATESQAIDRAHRIGQTKKVAVYRLITSNSIEEKMMALKERKNRLVQSLVGEAGNNALRLSKEELQFLLGLSI